MPLPSEGTTNCQGLGEETWIRWRIRFRGSKGIQDGKETTLVRMTDPLRRELGAVELLA